MKGVMMKRLFLILVIASIFAVGMAVNSQNTARHREYATVNVAPEAAGYFTLPVNVMKKGVTRTYFSIRGTGLMVVTLQYRRPGDTVWTVYDTYTAVTHQTIAVDAVGGNWRAGVLGNDYISGECRFGFDW